jgi:hypothetical protein
MWEEFFPQANIYGVDIDIKCKQFEGGRRKIFIGDQGDRSFLEEVVAGVDGSLDVVIDDGSHYFEHQLGTFDYLFPALSEHGIYVLEDVGGGGEKRTANAMKQIVGHILYWPSGFPGKDWPYLSSFPEDAAWVDRNVIGIAFYRHIIFILRGKNPSDNPFLKPIESKPY